MLARGVASCQIRAALGQKALEVSKTNRESGRPHNLSGWEPVVRSRPPLSPLLSGKLREVSPQRSLTPGPAVRRSVYAG